MINALRIGRELQNEYIKYLNSGIKLKYESAREERTKLFEIPGTLMQSPIIEITNKYQGKKSIEEVCSDLNISKDFAAFLNDGLLYSDTTDKNFEYKLYEHQIKAIEDTIRKNKHCIMTTGTGSGKTECFLIPLLYRLYAESKKWKSQRKRAVRAIILYPLNALAEDQMVRLRKSLDDVRPDGGGSRKWIEKTTLGNKFYFGRYTGKTPLNWEKRKDAISEWHELSDAINESFEEYKETQNKDAFNAYRGHRSYRFSIPNPTKESAELNTREEMKETPPDILVTNYSMLNVMLMRDEENCFFDNTKEWLKEDPNNVFTLVVDELHTYRGTSGTEVAYIIKILLDRLGINADSKQVQFLGSSASLENNEESRDFLR
jgi:DEAD/DEAH box helicase domain-containing protein